MSQPPPRMHFVGIGGTGMSALADIYLARGARISGSDVKKSPASERLQAKGAAVYYGHRRENLPPDTQLVVVSSAIKPGNPEVEAARQQGIPIVSRGELLAGLVQEYRSIAIAGTHGKTTTTAMVGLALEAGGVDPTVLVGGEVEEYGSNARVGCSGWLVTEADESDGSFLCLRPLLAVVTNVEDDHLNYYGRMEDIHNAFRTFLRRLPPDGAAVLWAGDPALAGMAPEIQASLITYGFTDAACCAGTLQAVGVGWQTEVFYQGERLGELRLSVPGRHNVLNALAAIAVACHLRLDYAAVAAALERFRGVHRRFQVLGRTAGRWVVDDYAHHPTEVKATLDAAAQLHPRRIVAVFQPHRYTRTWQLYREFGSAFDEAQQVIVTDIYSAGEEPLDGVGAELIVQAIRQQGRTSVKYMPSRQEIVQYLARYSRPGDLIITMGAGDVYTIGEEFIRTSGDGKVSL